MIITFQMLRDSAMRDGIRSIDHIGCLTMLELEARYFDGSSVKRAIPAIHTPTLMEANSIAPDDYEGEGLTVFLNLHEMYQAGFINEHQLRGLLPSTRISNKAKIKAFWQSYLMDM